MVRFWVITAAVVVACIASLWIGLNRYGKFDLRDAADDDLAHRYRLACGARADVVLNESRIPKELAPLIPYAKQFGHVSHLTRKDCANQLSAEHVNRFTETIDSLAPRVLDWVNRYPPDFPAVEVSSFRSLILLRGEIVIASERRI